MFLLAGLISISLPNVAFAAFGGNINEYADQCARELGAGEGHYLPLGVMPDDANAEEVPVYWNKKIISYQETNPATGAPMPGSGHWEYLFNGSPGGIGFPDVRNTVGRITDKNDLRCDYWSLVNPANGCLPGQRVIQRMDGDVVWSYIFRRSEPPRPGQANWDEFHPLYFKIMDVNAYKPSTGGVCWFDTLNTMALTVDEWWTKPGLPAGIPRPGGRDVAKRARAGAFWDTPDDMSSADGDCTQCHGNGPVLSSRWINQGGAVPFQLPNGQRDDLNPYWNAARLLNDRIMFARTADGKNCGSCHRLWSRETRTCPGGSFADLMTSLGKCVGGTAPDKLCATDSQCPGGGSCGRHPLVERLASAHRLQLMICLGGVNEGKACTADGDCPGSTCNRVQDAGAMYEMPHPFRGTPDDWENRQRPLYDAMKACCSGAIGNCRDPKVATVPTFYGAQGPAPAAPNQLVAPPDSALMFAVSRFNCMVAVDGSETCDYKATWDDPVNDYQAPDNYYVETASALNLPGVPAPKTNGFCPSLTPTDEQPSAPIAGSNWRRHHELKAKAIPQCSKIELRLCGGYAVTNPPPAQGPPPKESRNRGVTGVVETACPAKPCANGRSGFEPKATCPSDCCFTVIPVPNSFDPPGLGVCVDSSLCVPPVPFLACSSGPAGQFKCDRSCGPAEPGGVGGCCLTFNPGIAGICVPQSNCSSSCP